MDHSERPKEDLDKDQLIQSRPTPYELASVAAVLSLREAGSDLDQLFDRALHLLRGARQKLIDEETAQKRSRLAEQAAKRAALRPSLLFDPSGRDDEVRAHLQLARTGRGRALKNVKKASTLLKKFRVYCTDMEVILGVEEEKRGVFAENFLVPDQGTNPLREVYRVPRSELDCFVAWRYEVEQLAASARGGHPPSALEVLDRLRAVAMHGGRGGSIANLRKRLSKTPQRPEAEKTSSKIISEIRSLMSLNRRNNKGSTFKPSKFPCGSTALREP